MMKPHNNGNSTVYSIPRFRRDFSSKLLYPYCYPRYLSAYSVLLVSTQEDSLKTKQNNMTTRAVLTPLKNPSTATTTAVDDETTQQWEFDGLFDTPLEQFAIGPDLHLRDRMHTLHRTLNTTPLVKFGDKLSFMLGVSNVFVTPYILGALPQWERVWFTVRALPLLGLRYWTYRQKRMHYFLLDMCYLVNVMCLVYLWVPLMASRALLIATYSLATGPVVWAVAAWRNSMVFHSADKMTSIFIHLAPPMLVGALRHVPLSDRHGICAAGLCDNVTWNEFMLYGLGTYLAWQIGYHIWVERISADHIDANGYVTSVKWLLKDRTHIVSKIADKFPNRSRVLVLAVVQLLYTVITIVPVKLFWDHFVLNQLLIVLIGMWAAWNGANFYIEVFSKRYISELASRVTDVAVTTPRGTQLMTEVLQSAHDVLSSAQQNIKSE
eukprot:TRINITY_DN995_c0_g2_i3.p1 TRINITY_DN995_c0_g2~~TRINITY_DN995_c0_g2_i3.p1  ORF type:complete len:437 (+),score=60.16 TRINITY_DN995_c0_g2_i3:209-1519(+)